MFWESSRADSYCFRRFWYCWFSWFEYSLKTSICWFSLISSVFVFSYPSKTFCMSITAIFTSAAAAPAQSATASSAAARYCFMVRVSFPEKKFSLNIEPVLKYTT